MTNKLEKTLDKIDKISYNMEEYLTGFCIGMFNSTIGLPANLTMKAGAGLAGTNPEEVFIPCQSKADKAGRISAYALVAGTGLYLLFS